MPYLERLRETITTVLMVNACHVYTGMTLLGRVCETSLSKVKKSAAKQSKQSAACVRTMDGTRTYTHAITWLRVPVTCALYSQ